MIEADLSRLLFSRTKIDGYGIDMELAYLASLWGASVGETAVKWHFVKGSKKSIMTPWRMVRDLLRIQELHKGESIPAIPLRLEDRERKRA